MALAPLPIARACRSSPPITTLVDGTGLVTSFEIAKILVRLGYWQSTGDHDRLRDRGP